MRKARPLVVALVAGAVFLGAAPLAHATFLASAKATASFSAGQLAAPSTLTATPRCTLDALGLVVGAVLDLAWTPSTTDWATGQSVIVTDSLGVVVGSKTVGPTETSTSIDLPLVSSGTYTASVRATYESWSSAPVTATSAGC